MGGGYVEDNALMGTHWKMDYMMKVMFQVWNYASQNVIIWKTVLVLKWNQTILVIQHQGKLLTAFIGGSMGALIFMYVHLFSDINSNHFCFRSQVCADADMVENVAFTVFDKGGKEHVSDQLMQSRQT